MGISQKSLGELGPDRPRWEWLYPYLLGLGLAYFVTDLGLVTLRSAMLPGSKNRVKQDNAREPNTRMVNLFDISRRNVFSFDGNIPPRLAEDAGRTEVDAPAIPSQLPLQLLGSIVHTDETRSVATIQFTSRNKIESYGVGDTAENLIKLKKIEARKVTFRNLNTNRLEYIEIPEDIKFTIGAKPKPIASDNDLVDKEGEFDFAVRRADVEKLTQNLPELLQQAKAVPYLEPGGGGQVAGFKFVSIQPGSIIEKLGIKVGDVISEVNGEPVNSPTKAMDLYRSLKSESQIQLSIMRDGRVENFNYNINN